MPNSGVFVPKTSITDVTDKTYIPVVSTDANVVPGTASAGQVGTFTQGAASTSNPAYTSGQVVPLSLTTAGGLRVVLIPAVNGGSTIARVMSAATTNATSVKASTGVLYSVSLANTGAAAVFVKLYNKASAPTVGTDVPVWTITIGAGAQINCSFDLGLAFATGIAYAITNLVADTDTTAVVLNQVTGMLAYA